MSKPLRKVVFPVAGLGTRFLPATKVVAKEMLPVLDRPLIQYAVDEAVDAGWHADGALAAILGAEPTGTEQQNGDSPMRDDQG